jgi:hypothetical protein
VKLCKKKQQIREAIEIDNDLLSALRRYECLTDEECKIITDEKHRYKRADVLLCCVLNMSSKQYSLFLSALREAGQQHVAHFIDVDGGLLCRFDYQMFEDHI